MQKHDMADESVSEGLHRASLKLRKSWVSENTVRAAKRTAIPSGQDVTVSGQRDTRESRHAQLVEEEELPLYWIPYVHFGI
jgi:hypothetical protein